VALRIGTQVGVEQKKWLLKKTQQKTKQKHMLPFCKPEFTYQEAAFSGGINMVQVEICFWFVSFLGHLLN
jgi:hypothetical protein